MSRNGSGVYSRVNTFSSGSTITAAGHNANWADLETEMTNSLPRDGQAGMSGQFKAANGTLAAPSITFDSDPDTGFYRSAANTIGIVVGGALVGTIGAAGLSLLGTTTNDDAAAGYIGEFISSNVDSASGISMTSTVTHTITSISLTAGDWDVSGNVVNNPVSGSLLTSFSGSISTSNATLPTFPGAGALAVIQNEFPATSVVAMPVGTRRLTLASTTTVYLVARTVMTIAGQNVYGFIGARRVR